MLQRKRRGVSFAIKTRPYKEEEEHGEVVNGKENPLMKKGNGGRKPHG